jgi:hypothetical protein
MNTRYLHLISLLFIIICASCSQSVNPNSTVLVVESPASATTAPTASIGTVTPTPNLTATSDWATFQVTMAALKTEVAIISNRPTNTPTITPTPSATWKPIVETYPLKTVWIEFGSTPDSLADYDMTFPVTIPDWVLYTDGTILLYRNGTFLTKKLTENEICSLLARIKRVGFFDVKTNGTSYKDDPIYVNPPPELLHTDDAYECLFVNGSSPKGLCVYRPIRDYTTTQVKTIMNVLGVYFPAGLQLYPPDRLGLYVYSGRPYPESIKREPEPWPSYATALRENNQGSLYLEGEMAAKIYGIFKEPYTWLVFTEEGREYTVVARPLLPHERRTDFGIEEKKHRLSLPPYADRLEKG